MGKFSGHVFLIFFYLVKINKLIFFNLNADVAFFIINLGHVDINLVLFILPFVMSAFSVSDVTAKTKIGSVFQNRD